MQKKIINVTGGAIMEDEKLLDVDFETNHSVEDEGKDTSNEKRVMTEVMTDKPGKVDVCEVSDEKKEEPKEPKKKKGRKKNLNLNIVSEQERVQIKPPSQPQQPITLQAGEVIPVVTEEDDVKRLETARKGFAKSISKAEAILFSKLFDTHIDKDEEDLLYIVWKNYADYKITSLQAADERMLYMQIIVVHIGLLILHYDDITRKLKKQRQQDNKQSVPSTTVPVTVPTVPISVPDTVSDKSDNIVKVEETVTINKPAPVR